MFTPVKIIGSYYKNSRLSGFTSVWCTAYWTGDNSISMKNWTDVTQNIVNPCLSRGKYNEVTKRKENLIYYDKRRNRRLMKNKCNYIHVKSFVHTYTHT